MTAEYYGLSGTSKYGLIKEYGKYGIILESTKYRITPIIYDEISWDNEIGAFSVFLNDKSGKIDQEGKIIIPLIFQYIWHFKNGICAVKLDNKYGCIDLYGKIVIPIIYDDDINFEGPYSLNILNGKPIVINKKGNKMVFLSYITNLLFSIIKLFISKDRLNEKLM